MMIYHFFGDKNHLEHSIFRKIFREHRTLTPARGSAPGTLLSAAPSDPCRTFLASLAGCKVGDCFLKQSKDLPLCKVSSRLYNPTQLLLDIWIF